MTCCLCGGAFDERALDGTWLDRRCPLCDGRLSEEAYDEAAAHAQAGERSQLALARYYTSEWFRLACAGSGSEAPDKGLFGLAPGYAADGTFTLEPADIDRAPEGGLGVSAEYFVFDALRAEIVRPESPLAGAFLVPHLVFPWLPGQKPKQWGAKHRAELDCVLMCASLAIVVEVKRRNHYVRVSADQRHVRESTGTGSFRSSGELIEQVERGADSFAERQKLYPPERIFKMIVFVDALSVEGSGKSFVDGWLVGCLGDKGRARLAGALERAVADFGAIARPDDVRSLSERMLREFGNTKARREGSLVRTGDPSGIGKRSASFLKELDKATRDESSPLAGSHLLEGVVCEVESGRRGKNGKPAKTKLVSFAGLLLTRSHAVLIDARRWPVHVNTHAPFATAYTGDPADGAQCVEADIRHDWDLDEIHYRNRSGSLTLLTYAAKSIVDLACYRERNRVCAMHVFIDPASFVSDCEEFRSRTYCGFWRGSDDNVFAALAALEASAPPIMSQCELDRFADSLM